MGLGAAAAGVAGLATSSRLARRYGLIPPDRGHPVWGGRDADVCGTTAADAALAGEGVPEEHDFEGAVCECGCAARREF